MEYWNTVYKTQQLYNYLPVFYYSSIPLLHFAVAGAPLSTPSPGGTVEGLKRAHDLGITAMEIEWVQRVPNAPKHMEEIRKVAEDLNMYLTVHAPYFV
ncbi:MAG: hypothetical protein ABIA92_01970, partial [Patescibacteria group bacterium]